MPDGGFFIYEAVRSSEFDTYNEFPGSLIAVEEGSTNADTLWFCTSNDGGTLGTTAIAFSKMVIAGELLAANNPSDVANATTARGNLSAAKSGDNSDITSLVGVSNASNAASGKIGETLSASAAGVAQTSGAYKTIASLSLTAGDWLVFVSGTSVPAASTPQVYWELSTSLVDNTRDSGFITAFGGIFFATNTVLAFSAPVRRVNVNATITVYAVMRNDFSVSTLTANSKIVAVRVR